LAERLTVHRIGLWLFAVTTVIFLSSPIWDLSDARYSMLLSENIIRNHSVYMNAYQFPGPIQEAERCVSPSVPLQSAFLTYQLNRVRGNVVYCYPNGISILSIPFVGLMNALGVHCYGQDGRYLPLGEGCAARLRSAHKFSRAEIATALSLLVLSIAINGRGAISVAPVTWNVEVDIDRYPERVWNWSNPQFMAGLLWMRKK
jgi:hypothetical protein